MKILQFQSLLSENNIQHGISTRAYGSIKNQNGSINKVSLENFLNDLNLPFDKAVKMNQTHSGNIAIVGVDDGGLSDGVDGLITNKKNIPLYVLTADCLPILFYDTKKQIIGVAHAGSKGLIAGIIANTLNKFVNEFQSNPKDIIVGIGPGIEQKCYEVNGEYIDIRQIAIEQLINSGINKSDIESLDICTKCSGDEFYSYRNGDVYNRFATVISLV